jgi:hypothetical protein
MPCLLTSGYNFAGCKGGAGGISEVLITEIENLTSSTFTANVYTALTMSTGKQFRRYILDKEMGSWSDNGTYTKESGTYTYAPTVSFTIKGISTALQAELKLIAQNTLILIVKDRNGVYRLFGREKGMDLMTVESTVGKAMTDFAGFNLNFVGGEIDFAHEVQTSLITALLSPAA